MFLCYSYIIAIILGRLSTKNLMYFVFSADGIVRHRTSNTTDGSTCTKSDHTHIFQQISKLIDMYTTIYAGIDNKGICPCLNIVNLRSILLRLHYQFTILNNNFLVCICIMLIIC